MRVLLNHTLLKISFGFTSYKNLTAVSETAKTSLIDDKFDASLGTQTQILPNKLDIKVVGNV